MPKSERDGDEVLTVARDLWGGDAEATMAALRELGGAITPERLAELQEQAAWNRRWRDRRLQPARRTCLGPRCRGRRSFDSAHAGHRLCPRCRALLAALYGEFDALGEAS